MAKDEGGYTDGSFGIGGAKASEARRNCWIRRGSSYVRVFSICIL